METELMKKNWVNTWFTGNKLMTLISTSRNWTQPKDSKTQELPDGAAQQLQDGAELFKEEEEKEDKRRRIKINEK